MTAVDLEQQADPRPDPPRERRTVPAGAFVIAVLVAGALAVLAVFALASGDSADGGGGEDQEVRLASGRFAERFLTFEHGQLDAWKEDVLALSTGGFAEEVEEVESGLRTLIAESELDAVTQVTDIFVGEVERGGVEVVVVYDRELRGGEQGRTESDRYLQLAMVRVDGEWLVDNVLDIASAGDLAGSVPPSGEVPETPAPPTSAGG
ncbi:hypothetical protein NHL50_15965 [Acidimicrobiia bacterium EGI L10123]|uniref:hypothetical protein n=1 Tax=Salinilacustrithrix flava TaxID=2957203 RepID=UPI003D7C16BF|nr:hypothetical protein [Acidimicrobiia bacterium EGI L10123]